MHYLHILTMHNLAGLEYETFHFIKTSQKHKHSLLVTSKPINELFRNSLSSTATIKHWKYLGHLKIPWFLRSVFLKKWLKRKKIDIVISHSQLSFPSLWNTVFKNIKAPRIYYEHGAAWFKSKMHQNLLESFDGYIANSNASALMLEKKFGIKKDKIKVIHNGLPKEKFINIGKTKPVKKDKNKFIIMYLGRLVRVKGVNSVVEAMKYLDNNFELWIVGAGKEQVVLEKLILQLGVEDRVFFKGSQMDPAPFLKAADVLVVPSLREPLGNVILEAGAAKCAVIASEIDGIPDIISDGYNGVLIVPSVEIKDLKVRKKMPEAVVDSKSRRILSPRYLNPEEIAEEVIRLKKDTQLLRMLGNNLYETVRKNFIKENKTIELEKEINKLL